MNILFLSGWLPYPPDNGSKLRISNLLQGLASKHDITLLSFADRQDRNVHMAVARSMCRAVIEQVGMFDERFVIYFEETDWCVRAREGGWRLMNLPQAKLWHKGVKRDYKPKPSFTYYSTRNRFLLLAKHKAPLMAWIVAWEQTLRTLTSWTMKPKWRHKREHRDAMWQGMLDFLRRHWGAMS